MAERDDTIESPATDVPDAPPDDNATDDYRVHVEAFEGPLDLLLYLIRKEEVSIYDIPIARVTEQYLEYVKLMEEIDISVAGDFIVMAATLIHIKTKMLLPRDPFAEATEELEDPRQELVERLLEHQKYKSAAEFLHQRAVLEREVFTRPLSEEEKSNMEVSAGVFDLLTAFRDVLLRAQALMEIEIARDEVTLAQKLAELEAIMDAREHINVRELFDTSRSRRELVITFLAILEMVKALKIRIVQAGAFGDIEAHKRAPEPERAPEDEAEPEPARPAETGEEAVRNDG